MSNASPSAAQNPAEMTDNKGKITLKIDNDFYDLPGQQYVPVLSGVSGEDMHQSEMVHVRGLEWKILCQILEKDGAVLRGDGKLVFSVVTKLLLSLACSEIADGQEYDVSGRLSVHTNNPQNAIIKTFLFARTFTAKKREFSGDFLEIDMNKDLHFDRTSEHLIVEVVFTVEQREAKKTLNADLLKIKVDENYVSVDVNKYLLALNSDYFKTLFFENRFPIGDGEEHKIALPESTTVEDFKQLVEILEEKSTLSDDSIYGTFILANFFGFQKLETKCRKFLVEHSAKSIPFKYQLAKICGSDCLKDTILENMTAEDISNEENFMEECRMVLDKTAFAAFEARLEELKVLVENSAEPILLKYKFANICGFTQFKDKIMENMTADDIGTGYWDKKGFVKKCKKQLDEHAYAAFEARPKELNILDKNEHLLRAPITPCGTSESSKNDDDDQEGDEEDEQGAEEMEK